MPGEGGIYGRLAFDTLQCGRKLKAAGLTEQQADALAEIMAEAFVHNVDQLVTKDYLDARLDARFAEVEGKFRLVYWMLAVIIASTTIPALHSLLAG
ncbi:hypothetical protein [Parahaliea mediterranea]|uniref:DUF1640 domain-containing protein n=1 Tax=Parahaliea mediterranea TaxID=651086 RepID=A0A939DGC9_9GAMM|nr:hypothetical protein [Parahaliea mediterranea]MBN7797768.1 hypothetical protein [Parahaliea mediterranea]